MSRRRTAVLIALLAATGTHASCDGAGESLTPERESAIRDSVGDALAAFQRHSTAGEWDSLAGLYSVSPGFRFAESGVVQYGSASEVRAALDRLPGGTSIETALEDPHVDAVAPGVAVVTAPFESTFVDPAGGRFTFGGVVTMVWVHEASGWRIRGGHSSVPVARGADEGTSVE